MCTNHDKEAGGSWTTADAIDSPRLNIRAVTNQAQFHAPASVLVRAQPRGEHVDMVS